MADEAWSRSVTVGCPISTAGYTALSPDERAVLIFYCFDHPVAECARCRRPFREIELATDYFKGHTHLCPFCNED